MKYTETSKILKQIRMKNAVVRQTLAKRLNIHPQTVYNWENGKAFIPVRKIDQVLKLLKATESERQSIFTALAKDREDNLISKIKAAKG